MRLSRWHLIVWVILWVITAGFAASVCVRYNSFAGTDKTPQHIAAISVGVVFGPNVGPLANSGTFSGDLSLLIMDWVLLVALFASLTPFVLIKSQVSQFVHFFAWCGYLAACLAWFGSAILSLGYFLS